MGRGEEGARLRPPGDAQQQVNMLHLKGGSVLLLLLLLHGCHTGPDRLQAGQQVCISYGSWPAEPFLLLWGFVPLQNPNDSVTVYSSLQHMAACYLDCLADRLKAASLTAHFPAHHLLNDARYLEALERQVLAAEEWSKDQQPGALSSSSVGFRSMTVDASGIDRRLKGALQVLHAAVAAAAAAVLQEAGSNHSCGPSSSSSPSAAATLPPALKKQGEVTPDPNEVQLAAAVKQLQVPLGELLVHSLLQLAEQLEGNCTTVQQQQCTVDNAPVGSTTACASSIIMHTPSAEHAELIRAYCSSKAALARQLASGYPIRISGVYLV